MKLIKVISLGMFLFTVVFASQNVSIKKILKNPDEYHGKFVIVEGEVENLSLKTSKKGNHYTTFSLRDKEGNLLKVFIWGHEKIKNQDIKNGDKVEVSGIFYKVKYVGKYKFYNEIEAEDIKKLKKD